MSLILLFSAGILVHTNGEPKCSQDVDDLDAQVKVIQVLLKDS